MIKIAICIFLASIGFAALPPLAQSTREIQTILADKRLYDSFGKGEMIQEILKRENGYLIVTQNYAMQVNVQYEHRGIGPIHFTLEFQEPLLRSNAAELMQ